MDKKQSKRAYDIQYAKDKLKRIPLDVPKAAYEDVKAHAQAQGETVNGFIKRAISETMERDKAHTDSSIEEAADNTDNERSTYLDSVYDDVVRIAEELDRERGK